MRAAALGCDCAPVKMASVGTHTRERSYTHPEPPRRHARAGGLSLRAGIIRDHASHLRLRITVAPCRARVTRSG